MTQTPSVAKRLDVNVVRRFVYPYAPLSIPEDVHLTAKEPLMPGWSVVRYQTNTVSWSARLSVGNNVATTSLKHFS